MRTPPGMRNYPMRTGLRLCCVRPHASALSATSGTTSIHQQCIDLTQLHVRSAIAAATIGKQQYPLQMADANVISEDLPSNEDELEEEYEEGDEYEDEDELLEEEMGSSSERVVPVQGSEDEQPGPSSAQQGRRGRNPLAVFSGLRPSRLIKLVQSQGQRVQHLIWSLEDASVITGKFALKFAVKAIRPVLMWYIVSRATQTVGRGRDLAIRTARQPPEQQADYYYRNLLGPDWEQQLQQDMLNSLAEVQAGYITDDMVEEKRKLAAVMLRRMEVDEWDKQRMRHFYYGLYGLGPWYWDMEERLHNPFFVTARGWNSPPENWINQNQTFADAVPAGSVDCCEAVVSQVVPRGGQVQQEGLSPLDSALSSKLLAGVGEPLALRQQALQLQAERV